jgi:hypothetical protein
MQQVFAQSEIIVLDTDQTEGPTKINIIEE